MPEFQLARNRDAYAALRGFRYQVDMTILRWLRLEPEQTLELERGEDIDLVTGVLSDPVNEQERVLEQVKHRIAPITLKSPPAVSVMANAVEHHRSNPNLHLIIRFCTNACPTMERPSPFEPRCPGIEAWETLRKSTTEDPGHADLILGIRTILRSTARPDDLPETTWSRFHKFASDAPDEEIHRFVRSFEWSTGGPAPEQLEARVCEALQDLGHSDSIQHARQLYQRLFLEVFKRLSQPGLKRLTRDDLTSLLSLPTLTDQDRAILERLELRVLRLETRVDAIEHSVREHSQIVSNALSQRTDAEGILASISQSPTFVEVDLPPKSNRLSSRAETVSALHKHLTSCNWVALHGTVGCGKTHLAILLAESHESHGIWIRFRDLDASQAYSRLTSVFRQLTSSDPARSTERLIRDALQSLRAGCLIVLDDLPSLATDEEFTSLLVRLTEACREHGSFLLSTSHFALPIGVADVLVSGRLRELQAPPFTDPDAAELFAAYGAPSEILTKTFIQFLNHISEGHATILVALTRHLSSENWTFDEAQLDALVGRDHMSGVLDQTIARLLATIDDPDSRRLLYRLAVAVGSFGQAEVNAVADIEPSLTRTRERLQSLAGLWVQSETTGKMTVSPLVRPLATTELARPEMSGTHLALADCIIRRTRIDILEAGTAVAHLFAAQAFNRAALFLIQAFDSVRDFPPDDLRLLLAISHATVTLPADMDGGLALYLRAVQIATYARVGQRPPERMLQEVDGLITSASEDEMWAVFMATSSLLPTLTNVDFHRAIEYLSRAISVYPTIRIGGHPLPELPDGISWANLIWLPVSGINTPSDLLSWVATLNVLSAENRRRTFEEFAGEAGCQLVVNRVWQHEAEKPEAQRDWQNVLQALEQVAGEARRLGIAPLHAMAIRTRIVVLGEYMDDLDAAVVTATDTLADKTLDSGSRFLITDAIGQQYLFRKRYDDASRCLERAHAVRTSAFPDQQCVSYLRRSAAVANTDPVAAESLAEKAVEIARSHPRQIGGMLAAVALGELAIARALTMDLSGAFRAAEETFETLLGCRDDPKDWKQQLVLLGRLCVHIQALAKTGCPPQEAADGGPYAPPFRGMFLSYQPTQDDHSRSEHVGYLYVALSETARYLADDERATDWALRGLDVVRREGPLSAVGFLAYRILPSLLSNKRYAEAIDVGLEAFVAFDAGRELEMRSGAVVASGLDALSILGGKPNEHWNRAEKEAVEQCVIPAMFCIGRTALTDREKALEHTHIVVDTCRAIAVTASWPELWHGAADAFEGALLQNVGRTELTRRANEAGQSGLEPVRLLGYMGMSLRPDVRLETAAIFQVMVLPYVAEVLCSTSPMYRHVVLSFLGEFWRYAFQRERFRLTSPSFVDEALESAIHQPEDKRAQVILRVVVQGFGIRFPANVDESARAWLRAASSD